MLRVNKVKAVYNDIVLALQEVSISVPEGGIVALIGTNGSGKSTTLKSVSGVLATENGKVSEGSIEFEGQRIDRLNPEQIAGLGIRHVLQGRSVFAELTTEENLLMGAYLKRDWHNLKTELARIYQYFPRLETLRRRKSGYLSGGEQQMLVIGRALMSHPRMILLDEPSLGLAPRLTSDIYEILKQINKEEKTSMLIAEQKARIVLSVASHGYILENGIIVSEGPASSLWKEQAIRECYLGTTDSSVVGRLEASP